MTRRDPPQLAEGLYALHDLRTVDWRAWRAAPQDERDAALSDGRTYLESQVAAAAGDFAVFSVLGHKADLLFVHLRPTMAALDTASRAFERTAFADFTERSFSYVSVTEASGYTEAAADYFDDEADVDPGLERYLNSRLYPSIPDAEFVSFYPMSKRRDPEQNWYDLPFDERADLMASHGDIGRGYAGKVTQIITGSTGFDDWEWGVTLFAGEMTDVKRLLTEMRFDPSTSKYAEFGPFFVGRRFPPRDLDAFLAGEPVPAEADDEGSAGDAGPMAADAESETADAALLAELESLDVDVVAPAGSHGLVCYSEAAPSTVAEQLDGLRGNFEHYDSHVQTDLVDREEGCAVVSIWTTERAADTAAGFLLELPGVIDHVSGSLGEHGDTERDAGEQESRDSEIDEQESSDSDATGGVSDGTADDIRSELAERDIYGGKPHGEDVFALVLYAEADPDALLSEVDSLRDGFDRYDTHVRTAVYEGTGTDRLAVVSIWETESAADTAAGYLAELPGIVARAGEESGFGTMGMFYTVKPEHRADFVETFDGVRELLSEMDGHVETDLMVNHADENDTFIASQWRAKEDAMAFFRSDAFRDTVRWGRDVLADRPRHVFLA